MELLGVRVELPANAPIVLLREAAGDRRVLPIYIGTAEAAAIAYALENVEVPRPMTHDLLRDILDELGAEPRPHRRHRAARAHLLRRDRAGGRQDNAPGVEPPLRRDRTRGPTGTPIFAEEQVLAEAGQAAADVADGDPVRSSSTSSGSSSNTSAWAFHPSPGPLAEVFGADVFDELPELVDELL